MRIVATLARIAFRLLLSLYPNEFRRSLGVVLRRDFEAGLAHETRALRVLRFGARELWDLVRNLPLEWRRSVAGPAPRSPRTSPRSPRSRTVTWIDHLSQDLRDAWRAALRTPATTTIIVVTMAIAIGANAAVFGLIDGVLLEPLPYPEADRLVYMNESFRQTQSKSASWLNYLDWRERNRTFVDMAARTWWSFTLTGEGDAQPVSAMLMTANLLDVLGVEPTLGRGFDPAEVEREERLVVLSNSLWRGRFGGQRSVLGRAITLDGAPHTVVGVMPAGLEPPLTGADLYAPISTLSDNDRARRGSHPGISVIGRLRPGVTLADARADMGRVAAALAREYPATNAEAGVNLYPLDEPFVGDARAVLWTMFAAVGLVLLVACANVANLMLVRASGRRRELAMRMALGASRGRTARQLVVESLGLSAVSAVIGLLVARGGIDLVRLLRPEGIPRLERAAVDGSVLAFTLATTVAAALLFGVLPAWRGSAARPAATLRDGNDRRVMASGGVRAALVVAEVALAFALLVGAGLMLRTVSNLLDADPGLDPQGIVTAYVPLSPQAYPTVDDRAGFYGRLLERLRTAPGVEAAAGVDPVPLGPSDRQWSIAPEGVENVDENGLRTDLANVTPGYFRLMGIPLLAGETFNGRETAENPVAVIDETLAERIFPGEEPVGRRFRFTGSNRPWVTVVGVVGHVKNYGVNAESRVQAYLPYTTSVWGLSVAVEASSGDPALLVPTIREQVAALDPDVPVTRVETMESLVRQRVARELLASRTLSLFGGVALAMALLGLYGVISYSVAVRTREIGLRRALGARAGRIVAGVVRRAVLLAVIGVGIGVVAALAAARLLGSLLWGVAPTDPTTLTLVGLGMVTVALLAALLPARRATAVSPTVALRD